MADWFIATEGVKVVKDSASLWPQIITGAFTVLAALGGVSLTHHYTLKREDRTAAKKLDSERLFIATELVFLLEQFAEGCAYVATDHGYQNQEGDTVPERSHPVLNYASVSGDWRVLPAKLMYRTRELPIMQGEAERTIDAVEAYPPEYDDFFEVRQYQYIRLGLKAIILARRLRQFAGLPNTRLDASPWSAQNVLWKEWRQERKRRHTQGVLLARSLAALKIQYQRNNDGNGVNHSE